MFNDTFYSNTSTYGTDEVTILRNGESASTTIPWTGKGIAWKSDVDEKFKKLSSGQMTDDLVLPYDGYKYYMCKTSGVCNGNAASDVGCPYFNSTSTCAANNRFGDVSNEEFIVWMRTSGLPTFRKLHRIIKTDLKKGDVLTLWVNNVFPVSGFSGKKKVVLSTTTWIGGQNDFLGWAYIVVAIICLLLAIGFGIKQIVHPREVAKASKLETALTEQPQ